MPKPQEIAGNALNLIDPERFTAIRKTFVGRGALGLSLSAMVRIVLDEWLDANKKGKRK